MPLNLSVIIRMAIRQICGPLNCNSVNSEKDEYLQSLLLANEVWSKVLFLHVFVSSRGGGLCMMSLPIWLPGPIERSQKYRSTSVYTSSI